MVLNILLWREGLSFLVTCDQSRHGLSRNLGDLSSGSPARVLAGLNTACSCRETGKSGHRRRRGQVPKSLGDMITGLWAVEQRWTWVSVSSSGGRKCGGGARAIVVTSGWRCRTGERMRGGGSSGVTCSKAVMADSQLRDCTRLLNCILSAVCTWGVCV